MTSGDATLPSEVAEIAEGAEGAQIAEVAAPTLTVATTSAAGDLISRELPISQEEAREALVRVSVRPWLGLA